MALGNYDELMMSTVTTTSTYQEIRCHRPQRRNCGCHRCAREFLYELRRCGCNRCYEEFRYEERRLMYNQYYDDCRAYENTQMMRIQYSNPIMQLKSGEDEMNIVEKVRNIKLSAGDKLLRKHGIVDAEGTLTEDGQELIWDKLLTQFKDEIVADLKEVEKETKCKDKK